MPKTNKTTEERFWDKVNTSGDCWEWTAYKDKNGYGMFNIDGKIQRAHRVAWFLEYGYYPEKPMQINHKCNNRGCVNPEHLYEGTQEQNTQDSIIAGTFVGDRNGFKKGHIPANTKLTQEQVNKIREESTGAWGEQTRFAKKYRVSKQQVSNILNGKQWS